MDKNLEGSLIALENVAKSGTALSGRQRGMLAAVRRHGGRDVAARVDVLVGLDESNRARKTAKTAKGVKGDAAAKRRADRRAFVDGE
ncbi:hypothetical protein [Rarobacter incanus]|uniref:Uncharacterized protein n=1 Tax=Rarobacter incanus TaxID=153494 RepID=A0A542SM49_9MICO|nr:hypothetical protein [Rarobacter incanus]TQK75701.1 hypothetical protein FB389_0334 [Rarobacter incanus]